MKKRRPTILITERRRAIKDYIEKYGNICYYCGIDLGIFKNHLDHIIPVKLGGKDEQDNLVLSCSFCNRAKWDNTLELFLKWLAHIRSGYFQCCARELIKLYTGRIAANEVDKFKLTEQDFDRLSKSYHD